jgi:uroporphyrin-III C-methyltransferase
MQSKLTLVGAGPGDPELISLKGVKALKNADVVLYDALVHPDILDHCRPDTPRIFVGKRAGMHSYQQEKINEMIVDQALNQGHVVRLKGGDPFIFGRGKEEIEFAEAYGIPTSVVPGISSINLPGYYGLPLTRRGVNESFWVITAVTKNGELSSDLKLATQTTATVVILMGLKKLDKIMEIFQAEDKAELPVAIISKGSWADGSLILGQVKDIQQKVLKANVPTPALIVLGEAIRTQPEFYAEIERLSAELLTKYER